MQKKRILASAYESQRWEWKDGEEGSSGDKIENSENEKKYWGDTGKGSQNTARRRQFLPKETECWVMKLYCLKSTEEERKCGREHL